MTAPVMSIAEVLGHQPALMDLPTFFKAAGIAASTGYQEAAKGALPIEIIRIGRRRYVRTTSAWRFLGLIPEGSGTSPEYQLGELAGNDEAAGYQPAAPVEQVASTSSANS